VTWSTMARSAGSASISAARAANSANSIARELPSPSVKQCGFVREWLARRRHGRTVAERGVEGERSDCTEIRAVRLEYNCGSLTGDWCVRRNCRLLSTAQHRNLRGPAGERSRVACAPRSREPRRSLRSRLTRPGRAKSPPLPGHERRTGERCVACAGVPSGFVAADNQRR
jgi:hypothetical protein